jgi:NAD(P)-dependent dehydrogenase (short-subunit alcohol dehydrogenase family)
MGGLHGTVSVLTGASRGIGRGIAIGLGEAGATVYVTGRSTSAAPGNLPGTVEQAAAEVTAAGGRGIAARCDHRDDAQVAAVFARVLAEQGRIDVLVNNAFGSPPQGVLWGGGPFWTLPIPLWDDLIDVGLRSHFIAAAHAAAAMVARGRGLIVNVASHFAATGKTPGSPVLIPYSVGKAGLHRLTADMATELDGTGIDVVELWPHPTRTEGVLADSTVFGDVRPRRSVPPAPLVLSARFSCGAIPPTATAPSSAPASEPAPGSPSCSSSTLLSAPRSPASASRRGSQCTTRVR